MRAARYRTRSRRLVHGSPDRPASDERTVATCADGEGWTATPDATARERRIVARMARRWGSEIVDALAGRETPESDTFDLAALR